MLKGYDLGRFRALYLAGERSDPDTLVWARDHLGVTVIDHWWQTETGWSITALCRGISAAEVRLGSPGKPVPGYDVRVLDAAGAELPAGEMGELCIKLPLPPSCLGGLWNGRERFRRAYLSAYPGYYQSGDAGYRDEDGYIYVMSRTDDIINVAGHRLSTGQIEEVLSAHAAIAECAVAGVSDALKGQVPVAFLTLKAGVSESHEAIAAQAVALVRDRIGPVASLKTVLVVPRLPKTRSGKILRATLRQLADGEVYKVPATIDDPAILTEIAAALAGAGFSPGAAEACG